MSFHDKLVLDKAMTFGNMSMSTVHVILTQIKYKPGWHLRIAHHVTGFGHPENSVVENPVPLGWVPIEASFPVVDINTGCNINLNIIKSIPMHVGERQFVELVYRFVQECEMHECAEMFNYKNFRVFDPHVNGQNWPPDTK